MAENTKENTASGFSIQERAPTPDEDVDSARILLQEGLLEEAKKLLHKVLIHHPGFVRAVEQLDSVRAEELNLILNRSASVRAPKGRPENPESIIRRLEKDLGVVLLDEAGELDPSRENWVHGHRDSPRQAFDLGVAFFEMGCFRDAIIELEDALRSVRITQTELGELGVAAATLCGECLVALGEGFAAKSFLLPIVNEPELGHETKIPLFYMVGRAEELLGNHVEAKTWFKKVIEVDPFFRDAGFRIRML
ncbi:MAG: hypothetical protein EBX52_04785 [Proteobacteria bacterium]|nr:hypothetical protein [Pseudomonadota bacterium]